MQTDKLYQDIKDNYQAVKAQVAEAAQAAGRKPEEITIIAVSKSFPASHAKAALAAGARDLGENRVQELCGKIADLRSEGLEPDWHLIGSLQRNKVKYIIGQTKLIHSIHSVSLLEAISKRSQQMGIVTELLLQVNVSGEASKQGFDPRELKAKLVSLAQLPAIRLRGLMTMAPLTDDQQRLLEVFKATQHLSKGLQEQLAANDFNLLSMGMSGDYQQAIACGATHIRIGSAIFGGRN